MNTQYKLFAEIAGVTYQDDLALRYFTELVVKKCINIIETQRISVGNSPAGELACEWTMQSLRECRDEINEYFGMGEKYSTLNRLDVK